MELLDWKKLLAKQAAGTATKAELEQLEVFADRLAEGQPVAIFSSDQEKQEVHDALRKRITIATEDSKQTSLPWLRMAASVAILLTISAALWLGIEQWATANMVVFTTGAGEVKTIELPDGSMVELGFSSRLEFPEVFDRTARPVSLDGQALFTVTKDPNRPFVVDAHGLTTKVLGTVFNIKAFAEDSVTLVSLLEGSVNVNGAGQEQVLKPHEQAFYDLRNGELTTQPFDSAAVVGWLAGDMVLQRTSFADLQRLIARKYGVEVVFDEPEIAAYTVSGTFINPGLNALLEVVCATKSLSHSETPDGHILIRHAK